ncbi:MAG: helix-turn-helix domain-containing protein [Candidatus Dormibacteraeota bacterium]|nr:helix-turn-helix domain-containing protein [Candidatus Dormibacteraeota bacterium]
MSVLGLAEEVRRERQFPSPVVLRLVREAAGVSQQRLAAELGVSRFTVLRYEAGRRRPRGAVLQRYMAVLEALQAEVGL